MPRTLRVLPDAPMAVVQYLRLRSEVTALVPSDRITTAIAPQPTYPVVIVQRIGGIALAKENIDEAAIQISVFGGSQYQCSTLARTIRAAISAIQNDTVSAGVLVSGWEESGLAWLPDETTTPPLSRFVARYQVITHP